MHYMHLALYRTGVEYPAQQVDMDPYMLGYWLGNGHADESVFTQYFQDNLRAYGLMPNKFIPRQYLINSREVRLQVLAGILDADATYQQAMKQYTLSQSITHERLFDDVIVLARSLGFACYKSHMVAKCNGKEYPAVTMNIVGDNLSEIPMKVPHKISVHSPRVHNPMRVSFTLEPQGEDFYYGVEVDKNHRYVMGDFTVTSNSNSKSKLLDLVQRAMGDYYCILPIALLTQKRAASNAAQSELERTKGRRCAVMQEPSDNERLNIGLMKELSGGDMIQARGLFKEPIEFKPQFKMIMTCNELPEVPSDDGGTWRRIRVIEFTSKFVERPDPSNPREFPLDSELSDKFDRWADTFISMIIDHHKHMDPKGITEPMDVRIATESYKKNNDVIGQFVTDKLVADPTSTQRILLQKLFNEFKSWAFQVLPKGKKVPDRNQLRAYIEKRFGPYPSSGGWKGIRYVTQAEEPDSDAE
jgi:P4 family phage/plasmid primase-like protien